MLPSLDGLKCFCEAARLLNFRAAARAVNLTPAALGQRIKQLEDQVGEKLFHRTTRSVVLTEAGLALVPYAHRALKAAEDCLWAGQGELGAPPMELVLGSRHELALSWVVPLLANLREVHPSMTFHLYIGSGSDLTNRVRSLDIDCAIASSRLTDPKLDSIRLHREDYVFVGQTELLKKNPLKKVEHASNHAIIDTTEAMPLFRYWRNAPGGMDSMQFNEVIRMGAIAAIRELVLRGNGVAVLPQYYVNADLKEGRLKKIMPSVKALSDHFRLIFRADDPRRSVYESISQTLMQHPLQ